MILYQERVNVGSKGWNRFGLLAGAVLLLVAPFQLWTMVAKRSGLQWLEDWPFLLLMLTGTLFYLWMSFLLIHSSLVQQVMIEVTEDHLVLCDLPPEN